MVLYEISLFLYSFEVPFFLVNFTWWLYFWYPQFDLSFNLSAFYVMSMILFCCDILAQWNESLAKWMKYFWSGYNKMQEEGSKAITKATPWWNKIVDFGKAKCEPATG